jgi:hypothetical protein
MAKETFEECLEILVRTGEVFMPNGYFWSVEDGKVLCAWHELDLHSPDSIAQLKESFEHCAGTFGADKCDTCQFIPTLKLDRS